MLSAYLPMRASVMEEITLNYDQKIASDANTIFLIDCLREDDKQSARTRHEGICDSLMALSAQNIIHDTSRVYHLQCRHRDNWSAAMKKIRDSCKVGLLPLVFIDGHGDAEKGLAMPSGGFICWQQYGQDLRAIMDAARGELTVVAGFCHSFAFIATAVNEEGKLPFGFYFGYKDEVLTSVVEDETQIIYESLINDGGQVLNSRSLEISSFNEYDHAEKIVGQVAFMRLRPEALVAEQPQLSKANLRKVLEKYLAQQGKPLGEMREIVKHVLSNTPRIAERLIDTYMHDTTRRSHFKKQILSQMEEADLPR